MADLHFDATTVEPSGTFETVPPGKYVVQIVASELRATKDGNGQYLWIEMDILEGEYTGRKLWDRLNLQNPNAQAVEIAQRTLSAICHAVGELNVANSEQLHLKPMVASVKVKPSTEQFEASNEIKGYAAVDGKAPNPKPAMQQTAAAAQPTASKPTTKQPPWRRTA